MLCSRTIVLKLCALALGAAFTFAASAQTTCSVLPLSGPDALGNTAKLQAAINQCSKAGGGLISLTGNNKLAPALVNTITLASNIVLKLDQDFVLLGNTTIPVNSAVIFGKNISNVTITGTGTIDGNGASYWAAALASGMADSPRPKLIKITGTNINIGANFTDTGTPQPVAASRVTFPTASNDTAGTLKIRNSPKEQVVFEAGSRNVHIDGVWIYANPGRNPQGKNIAPNTDGIDIVGTATANIANCVIDTGDDNIALKSNAGGPATSNVTISGCVIGGGHGISIGGQQAAGHTIASPGVSQVTATDVYFKGTDFGYRIKTDQTPADSGATTGVTYRNSCMLNVAQPFLFTYAYATGTGGVAPIIANITIDNVVATATKIQGAITGMDTNLMGATSTIDTGIRMTNSRITGGKPFAVTNGVLQLGRNSAVMTQANLVNNGSVVSIDDTGPSIACPASIVIPAQS